jgi:hypothetical protein
VRHPSSAIVMMAIIWATTGATADELDGCRGPEPERRIVACTALIDALDTTPAVRAEAFFRRAVSYAQLGQRQRAINDYDEVIRIRPEAVAALNNRAYSTLKLGKPSQALPDVEQALKIAPQNPMVNSTRGEIRQALGDRESAMRDHEEALALGGMFFVKLYQCSLRLARLYHGPVDGIIRPELRTALRLCVDQAASVPRSRRSRPRNVPSRSVDQYIGILLPRARQRHERKSPFAADA